METVIKVQPTWNFTYEKLSIISINCLSST